VASDSTHFGAFDQMIKYATAIRTGTASTEAILRRFTKANAVHPAYQAMAEVGRAQRTIFLARAGPGGTRRSSRAA
jgi:TnpA family transposase